MARAYAPHDLALIGVTIVATGRIQVSGAADITLG
jgi:hypothetical protein